MWMVLRHPDRHPESAIQVPAQAVQAVQAPPADLRLERDPEAGQLVGV
jgi:hypothetical protein